MRAALLLALAMVPARAQEAPRASEQVTVTATRRPASIMRVPINVTAFSQREMDVRSIRTVDDLANLTPDLVISHTSGSAGNNSGDIAIRNIASDVGASTTGVYIDDTPVQTRNIGYFAADAFPKVFDLERVELLRGPQGVLFGAGSEGGNLRFLTAQPSTTLASGYVRSEVGGTVGGDASLESGAAYGAPIIPGVLGYRASLWGRRDGGFIDRVDAQTGENLDANTNREESEAAAFALTWRPRQTLTVTPSVHWQDVYDHDRSQYFAYLSRPYADSFRTGEQTRQPADDHYVLPSLRVQYDAGVATLISDTSYFDRKQSETLDYTNYLASLFTGDPFAFDDAPPSNSFLTIRQRGITQELRVQSDTPDARVSWLVGLFYARNHQTESNFTTTGIDPPATLLDRRFSFVNLVGATDSQVAGFANVDATLLPGLTLAAGVRVSRVSFTTGNVNDGPVADGYSLFTGGERETPVTPRFSLSYQVNAANFLYVTVAKGFRAGGAQPAVPASFCAADLASLGLAGSPQTYRSDRLWSYEAGAKSDLFGGRLRLDASAYYIDWQGIQQNVRLPGCGFSFVGNLGTAAGVGGDIAATIRAGAGLSIGGMLAYDNTTANRAISAGNAALLVAAGDRIGGPPLNATAWVQQEFAVLDHASFARADFAFHGHSPSVDALVFSFDPTIAAVKAISTLSLRVGTDVGGWEVEGFANNVTNAETPISIADDIVGSPLLYQRSLRPPSYGFDLTHRF